MSVLVSDIVNAALRLSGVMRAPGRGASPEEMAEGLAVLNDITDTYNSQRLTVLSIARQVFNIVANQQNYQIGRASGADWVTDRPPKIENAGLISLANANQPLELPMSILTDDQWAQIPVKNITSGIPLNLWYNPDVPNGVCSIWPVPSQSNEIAIYGWPQIAAASTSSTVLVLAPGYRQALQYDLAVELCIRYRMQVPPDVRANAIDYKAKIKSVNIPTLDLVCDPALTPRVLPWNWLTGGFTR